MAYQKIPEKDAVLLIRALGLLVSQAGVYGPSHNVTQSAARSVFAELAQAVIAFGTLEIALRDGQMLINGSADGIQASAGKNLADRMALHKVTGLLFLSPPDLGDFLRCITLFGTQPLALAAEGGFEGAIKQAMLRSIRVVTVAYQRVEEGEELVVKKPPEEPQPAPAAARRPAVGVLDLSAAWSSEEETASEPEGEQDAETQARKKRASDLAALLRNAAEQLESGTGLTAHELSPGVAEALEQIRALLSDLTAGSERHISVLASRVNEDRMTIASIESAARRRGIGLKLTRAELLQQYAELNQEIMQPLTVSTGVIDMLNSGCTGALSEAQRELLKMAAESVERVNQLVSYMNRISGLPETYTPDRAVIADTYR